MIKPVYWLGDSRKAVRAFSSAGRRKTGIELFALQLGAEPSDWKPMRAIGPAVSEIRIHAEVEYRVIYVAKFKEAIYVLHAFTKKSPQTSLHDVRLARRRYHDLMAQREAR